MTSSRRSRRSFLFTFRIVCQTGVANAHPLKSVNLVVWFWMLKKLWNRSITPRRAFFNRFFFIWSHVVRYFDAVRFNQRLSYECDPDRSFFSILTTEALPLPSRTNLLLTHGPCASRFNALLFAVRMSTKLTSSNFFFFCRTVRGLFLLRIGLFSYNSQYL
jgi:hypothetical protein